MKTAICVAIVVIFSSIQSSSQATGVPEYWLDSSTGLMWTGRDNGKDVSWKKAVKYCRDLRLAGYSDWKLATLSELAAIYDKTADAPGLSMGSDFQWHVRGSLFLTGDQWSSEYIVDDRGKPSGYSWSLAHSAGTDLYCEAPNIMLINRKTFVCLIVFAAMARAQAPEVQRYVVLPQHSQSAIPPVLLWDRGSYGSWVPSDGEIQKLEANLSQIAELKIRFYESSPLRIQHPKEYFRQYVGVLHNGKRRIYINAFHDDPPPSDWRSRLYIVIDGATGYWHAFYDPDTGIFSDLTINARA